MASSSSSSSSSLKGVEEKQKEEKVGQRRLTGGLLSESGAEAMLSGDRTARKGAPLLSGPMLHASLSPSAASDISGNGGSETPREATYSEVSDGASAGGRGSSGSNRRLTGRPTGGRLGKRDRSKIGTSVDAQGSGSLLELSDALKAREQELLRLKRDVAVVATSAGGFKHLAASLGSGGKAGSPVGFGRCGSDGKGDGNRSSGSYSATGGGDSRPALAGGRKARVVDDVGDTINIKGGSLRSSREELMDELHRSSSEPSHGTHHASAPRGHGELLQAGSRDTASRLSLLPPQQPPTVSKGEPAASGLPLVASAHEGLRQLRGVLEQRARESGSAKDDAAKTVRW